MWSYNWARCRRGVVRDYYHTCVQFQAAFPLSTLDPSGWAPSTYTTEVPAFSSRNLHRSSQITW
ncbi:hypothetical protein I314_04019 [Cryptococcus bacillisporus CA1873]|uniref:Uncharacterized protein n=2 Tax=Cryptococcus gattii TaxID=552467 RepID=A0A0D0TKE3_CRYGA|nr:hypothetical protein I312_03836 [Cryptococcus bacillisporus CA1280]KIR60165.1 hypothetical protein I314_04019 [Cryptococcus bacillisporus CA1873]|eukprot:KIR60165.1 hypothetical protein I314_04019 [Cryptococcus gattii CA1873]